MNRIPMELVEHINEKGILKFKSFEFNVGFDPTNLKPDLWINIYINDTRLFTFSSINRQSYQKTRIYFCSMFIEHFDFWRSYFIINPLNIKFVRNFKNLSSGIAWSEYKKHNGVICEMIMIKLKRMERELNAIINTYSRNNGFRQKYLGKRKQFRKLHYMS